MDGKTTVERAFELARSGSCKSVSEIKRRLTTERYENVGSHLAGGSIGRQLKGLLDARKLIAATRLDDAEAELLTLSDEEVLRAARAAQDSSPEAEIVAGECERRGIDL
jgi:hypothetical protein